MAILIDLNCSALPLCQFWSYFFLSCKCNGTRISKGLNFNSTFEPLGIFSMDCNVISLIVCNRLMYYTQFGVHLSCGILDTILIIFNVCTTQIKADVFTWFIIKTLHLWDIVNVSQLEKKVSEVLIIWFSQMWFMLSLRVSSFSLLPSTRMCFSIQFI